MQRTSLRQKASTDARMIVKVKDVGSRRYVYLVLNTRRGKRVKQKSLCYLGPISKLVYGVPTDTRKKVRKLFRVDWDKIEDEIARIPLSFEELSEARHTEHFLPNWARRQGFRTQGTKPRTPGELSALSKIAARKFNEMFEEIGEREYRMR